jgi:hypothetical protein
LLNVDGFLKKLKIEIPYDPAIPLLGVYPKECRQEIPAYPFIAALFTIAKNWDQSRCPIMIR